MKDATYNIIKATIAGDDTVTEIEAAAILRFCRAPAFAVPMPEPVASPSERWISPTRASELLSVSLRTIQRWVKSGDLPSRRVSGCRRIPESALAALPHTAGAADRNPFGKSTVPAGLGRPDAMEA